MICQIIQFQIDPILGGGKPPGKKKTSFYWLVYFIIFAHKVVDITLDSRFRE